MTEDASASLRAEGVTLGYDGIDIVHGLDVAIPDGRITVIVGANACGKSTLLRGLARLLRPRGGVVLLDGQAISRLPTREVATRLGILPQQPIAPDGITVAELVARGRHPHQRWFRQWSTDDEVAVEAALIATGVSALAGRTVDELSGGQRQRVWIALALAQGTPLLLLDEPTTYLDIAHEMSAFELLDALARRGLAILVVSHQLNLGSRCADRVVLLHRGAVAASGSPSDVMRGDVLEQVYEWPLVVTRDPAVGAPALLPLRRRRNA